MDSRMSRQLLPGITRLIQQFERGEKRDIGKLIADIVRLLSDMQGNAQRDENDDSHDV